MNGHTLKKLERIKDAQEFLKQFFEDDTLLFHHRVLISDPMNRTCSGTSAPYKGKWGEGVKVDVPYWGEKTNRQHYRYFFIEKGKEGLEYPRKPEDPDALYQLC